MKSNKKQSAENLNKAAWIMYEALKYARLNLDMHTTPKTFLQVDNAINEYERLVK